MELIYQGLDKQEIVRMIEEIVEGLQQKGENYVGD
jgi:hypothetical protein